MSVYQYSHGQIEFHDFMRGPNGAQPSVEIEVAQVNKCVPHVHSFSLEMHTDEEYSELALNCVLEIFNS